MKLNTGKIASWDFGKNGSVFIVGSNYYGLPTHEYCQETATFL
jgi:hypothetical protein